MTPLEPEALEVAALVIGALRELGLDYHLGGSYASAVHGVPRQTHDIDLIVDMAPGVERELALALQDRFYVDQRSIARAIRERSCCNLVHLETGIKVDLFVKGTSPFDESEFARRVRIEFDAPPTEGVFVKSAEDTILRKLLWFRMGGEISDRQWQDVLGILGVQAERLDRSYLEEWANRLGIHDLLAEADESDD